MPPGRPPKRSRPSHPQSAPSPASNPEVSSNAHAATHHSIQASSPSHPPTSSVSTDDGDDGHPLTPFLNTTFSTHRLSPLHVGPQPLTQDRIHTLSHRLRDFLVGDVVRGVEVGLDRAADDGAMSRTGALETVAIAWVTLDGLIGPCPGRNQQQDGRERDPTLDGGDSGDDQTGDVSGSSTSTGAWASPGKTRGLQISLQYEHAECAALLLPSIQDAATSGNVAADHAPSAPDPLLNLAVGRPDEKDPAFLHLPLLLLRMPAPLKAAIISFLNRTFDCRVSSLSLGTQSLVRALETWTGELGPETNLNSARDVVLTLGFHPSTVMQCRRRRRQQEQHQQQDIVQIKQTTGYDDAPEASETASGLKSIDVIVPSADLLRFITAGKAYEMEKYAPPDQARDKRRRAGAECRDPYIEAKRRRFGGDKDEEGWTWRRWPAMSEHSGSRFDSGPPQPFIEALAQYVQQHLALDMFHPAVRISKIACGGFVLSEGRVKIFAMPPSVDGIPDAKQRATWGVLGGLLEKARVKPPDEKPRGVVGSPSD
ncbi:hypothetical protein INS49_005318 [Diaporthe citri]|uniref:uncharacterized protein n=1 Tax=Diaporthe citri TaxID=83186 RepID=UPI001C8136F3|nr:uncharacterized protein INS49_005318 [Diaporthe citri]KAG6353837.1 hypothetical protein INS49_005318 [Diaporthe citri]